MMGFGSMVEFLENKTLLVTGATGFLAKILIEKILRIQPQVKKLYLLIRAGDPQSANSRLQEQILSKDLFNVLKETWGTSFEAFTSEKIIPVFGDTSFENLGVNEDQRQEMYENIDVVVNLAATTNFNERYDVALGVNTFGAKNVLEFSKKCAKIQLLIHVSTAYVCGEKSGYICENEHVMGESLNGVTGLDIDRERKIVQQTLKNLEVADTSEKEIRQRMKALGFERAKLYGWPNTYVFTKAMGEMFVGQLRGDLPTIIMRPTIVTSTLNEPFPGWIEGCRTLDTFAVMYGKGMLTLAAFDKRTVCDMIPGDMFVNTMIMAMKAHVNQPCLTIYQVGSSFRNPITMKVLNEYFFGYFNDNPWRNHDDKLVNVPKLFVLSNVLLFDYSLFVCILLLQLIIFLASKVDCKSLRSFTINLEKKLRIVTILMESYRPYLFFQGIFVDTNTETLIKTAREEGLDEDVFQVDPEFINWKDYFYFIHFPAVVKYLF